MTKKSVLIEMHCSEKWSTKMFTISLSIYTYAYILTPFKNLNDTDIEF